jgi:hypothetical protein
MKIVISFLMLVIIASCGYLPINSLKIKVQDNVFVEGSRDIALLSGMHKINEDNIGFDSNVGSISSVIYSFENNPDDLLEFYLSTLNQLGWKKSDENFENTTNKILNKTAIINSSQKYNFRRDKENLSIEINSAKDNYFEHQKNNKFGNNHKIINTIKFFFSSSI